MKIILIAIINIKLKLRISTGSNIQLFIYHEVYDCILQLICQMHRMVWRMHKYTVSQKNDTDFEH